MFTQMAAVFCVVVVAAAQEVEQFCDRGSSCGEDKRRGGSALLQTDVGATVQAPAAEEQPTLLLETGTKEVAAKTEPLVGKVNTLVEDVSKLDKQVAGLEQAVGISRPKSGEAAPLEPVEAPLPAAPAEIPAATTEPAADVLPPEDTAVGEAVEPASMLESPPESEPPEGTWASEDDAFLEGPEGLNLRQTEAGRVAHRPFATLQRASSQRIAGGWKERQHPPAYQQPMALMKKASTAARAPAPAGSLKSKVAELEGRVADISSRIVSLENEVVGHAVSSLLELESSGQKISETPMVAAALNSRIISQQQTKAAGSGGSPRYMNALKSRTMRLEETIDDLMTRAKTLSEEILR